MLADLKERLIAINREKNATFVAIEHNMEFVVSLCSRVMVMSEQGPGDAATGRGAQEPSRNRSPSRTLKRVGE
ncbi:hypothetical protein QA640_41900 [Bradyrhizobium sp. CB82]|nr:hypothetical protein [Bradyrhizobium sp. CB82]WFU40644.1 hypothetical protein QA640_41900 [Bradyrhizobium sp. CB82]